MNEFEERARQEKVDRICSHLLSVYGSLKAEGALAEHSVPWLWASHPSFPMDAVVAASGAKPASELTKQMVLSELREERVKCLAALNGTPNTSRGASSSRNPGVGNGLGQ